MDLNPLHKLPETAFSQACRINYIMASATRVMADQTAKYFARRLTGRFWAEWKSFTPGFRHYAAALFIALFTVYQNSLPNGFVQFDDNDTFYSEEGLTSPNPLKYYRDSWDLNPLQTIRHAFVTRPVRDLSIYLDKLAFDSDPWFFHLSNLSYQYAASLGVFLAASLLLGSAGLGFLAALIFTLHPAQTEAVAYLGGRRDIIYGGLCLYSFYFLLLFQQKRKPAFLWLAALAWGLALLTKQAAIALPLAVLPFLYLRNTRAPQIAARPRLDRPAKLLSFIAGTAALAYLAINIQGQLQTMKANNMPLRSAYYGGSLQAQYLTIPVILAKAISISIIPVPLCGDYSYAAIRPVTSIADWRLAAALAGLLFISAITLKAWKKAPALSASIFFFFLAYAPMLPLLPLVHNREVFAEHWLYLPLFGFALMAALLLGRLREKHKGLFLACAAALLCFYSVITALRNPDWKDPLTFWGKTARQQPMCARASTNLSTVYAANGEINRAEDLLKRSLAIAPQYMPTILNLARVREFYGDHKGALSYLKTAAAVPGALQYAREINYNRGLVYLAKGETRKALVIFSEAEYRPIFCYAPMVYSYACALYMSGKPKKAEQYFKKALIFDPSFLPALYNLAFHYYGEGKYKEAAKYFAQALKLDPGSLPCLINLGLSESILGNYPEAVSLAAAALHLSPRSAEAQLAMSAIYRRGGRYRAAAKYAAAAVKSNPHSAEALLERALVNRKLGDTGAALEDINNALGNDAGNPELRYRLVAALWEMLAPAGGTNPALKNQKRSFFLNFGLPPP